MDDKDLLTMNDSLITWNRNPGYPGKYSTAGDCEWKITKLREDICQIRLDFQTMEIADPNGGIELNKLILIFCIYIYSGD